MNLPVEVQKILNKLKENGFMAVVVGGCVRDELMGENPHDYDIATSALPEQVQLIFADERKVEFGLKHGTVTIIYDHIPYEITTFRIDGEYSDHRRPDKVEFTEDLKQDLSRRDFTMNAIAYDGEKLYDYFGGVEDIKNKTIRCVGNPQDRFKEDPLRILRAVRFSSKFGFDIDSATQEAIMNPEIYNLLDMVSRERKSAEFDGIIMGDYSYVMIDWRTIIEKVVPQITTINDWELTVSKMKNKTYEEKLSFLVEDAFSDYDSAELAVKTFCKNMRYSNDVFSHVTKIINCQKEIFCDSSIFARKILQKYSSNIIAQAISCKTEKIKNNSALSQAEKEELYELLDKMIVTISKVRSDESNCYNLEKLKVKGKDLKALGIEGEEIGKWLNILLDLTQTGAVPNIKEMLLNVVKLSIYSS